ncbi:hypothetical protein AVEN_27679-1 [Araneus ventricosus]|uniref:Uncharacterized protein n=1 Tax=Araneus ventricosus TaxID=182803 RepID=A0A4Y2QUN1_ARAVE|nr:hypothetical protein AVEN_27679-1 [Araneus ventricosus]
MCCANDRWRGGIPSCTFVVKGFASITSFLESCFRSSLYDGFLQISTKSSYPISWRRRGVCSKSLSQKERGIQVEMIFRWCQRYEVGRVNIRDLPRPGQAHVVTNSATISAVDELIRQDCRITTREIAEGNVHHIIHKKLGYGKVCAQWVPKQLSENQKTARMGVCLIQQFLH